MPNLRTSEWQTITVAQSGTTSSEVDLGAAYRSLALVIPTIDSSTVTVSVSTATGGTFQSLSYISMNDGDDDPAIASASTGAITVVFPVFGFQFFKVVCGSAQTSAGRTFYARGFN